MTNERIIDISDFWDESNTKAIKDKYGIQTTDKSEVAIKQLSFGAQNKILDKVSNVNVKGKNVEVSPLYGELRTLTVHKCIVSAPFPNTLEYLENELPSNLGDFLFEQIDQFNNFRKEKKST